MKSHNSPHHQNHQWIINNEKTMNIKEIGESIEKVGATLKSNGRIVVNGVNVIPGNEPYFTLRYERLPRGELKLKLEIEWNDGGEENKSDDPLVIE